MIEIFDIKDDKMKAFFKEYFKSEVIIECLSKAGLKYSDYEKFSNTSEFIKIKEAIYNYKLDSIKNKFIASSDINELKLFIESTTKLKSDSTQTETDNELAAAFKRIAANISSSKK